MENLIKKICNLHNIDCKQIKKSESGFTNFVFFVNNKYVIKVVNTFTKPEKLQKEIDFYKNIKLDFIPDYVASGVIDGTDYLIIKKLSGKSLYKVWHLLNENQREDIVKQIANILNEFHKLKGDFLQPKFIQTGWLERWKRRFNLHISILKEKGFDTSFLEWFLDKKLPVIFAEEKPGLVYNDAHFDNFIYDNGKLYLIDFDRVLYCSIDYELLIIKSMIDKPTKFANESDEKYVNFDDYIKIYDLLKKYAPNMFDFEYIDDRVFVYQIIYYFGQGFESNDDKFIKECLIKFEKRFNK